MSAFLYGEQSVCHPLAKTTPRELNLASLLVCLRLKDFLSLTQTSMDSNSVLLNENTIGSFLTWPVIHSPINFDGKNPLNESDNADEYVFTSTPPLQHSMEYPSPFHNLLSLVMDILTPLQWSPSHAPPQRTICFHLLILSTQILVPSMVWISPLVNTLTKLSTWLLNFSYIVPQNSTQRWRH